MVAVAASRLENRHSGGFMKRVLLVGVAVALAGLGVWYLVILGVIAIVITLFLPRGLWGLISGNGRIRLFPVGYRVTSSAALLGLGASKDDDAPAADATAGA